MSLNPVLRFVNIRRQYDNVASILRFDPEVFDAYIDRQDRSHSFADHAAGLSFDRHRLQIEFVDSFSRGPEATKSTCIIENIPSVNGERAGKRKVPPEERAEVAYREDVVAFARTTQTQTPE